MNKRVVFSRVFGKAAAFFTLCLAIFAFFTSFLGSLSPANFSELSHASAMESAQLPNFKDIVKDLFGIDKKGQEKPPLSVYLGGYPLGFTLECEGVMVVALGSVETDQGTVTPTANKDIRAGDVIKQVNGVSVTSAAAFTEEVNKSGGQMPVCLVVAREGKTNMVSVVPAFEASTSTYRLGIWIRDNAAGVGTLTYVRQDNLRFGALGHPVLDIDTSKPFPIAGGNIYRCAIVGSNKGQKGSPGELRGLFLRSGEQAGVLDENNDFGVYGKVSGEYLEKISPKLVEVCYRDKVRTGPAQIYCTIDGTEPKLYDIEIVKLSYQSTSSTKSMVIKVTDKQLIEKTGGIVQGMSGSPILQDGKLVGAVTHVFVSDPTKGFGVYIDWMLDN